MMRPFRKILSRSASGFTLLEAVIGIAILGAGILAIMSLYPQTLRSNERAELLTIAGGAGLMKVEEIRRDNDVTRKLITSIETLPRPTEPVVFALDPRLAYRLSSTTMLYRHFNSSGQPFDDPTDPRDDPGLARVIIQIAPNYHPGDEVILAEFPFN